MTEAPSLVDEIAQLLDWHEEFTPEKEWHDQGADEWREHPGPMTQFLREILTNTGEDNLLKWDFTRIPVEFILSSTQ